MVVKSDNKNGPFVLKDLSDASFFARRFKNEVERLSVLSETVSTTYFNFGPVGQKQWTMCSNMPSAWRELYMKDKLFLNDPLIDLSRSAKEAFVSQDLSLSGAIPPSSRNANGLADQNRRVKSYIIPLEHNGSLGSMFFIEHSDDGSFLEGSDILRSLIRYEVDRFHKDFCEFLGSASFQISSLSTREEEVLLKLSHGKSQTEIATEANLSKKSIELYLKNARHKLEARTTCHAVALYLNAAHKFVAR